MAVMYKATIPLNPKTKKNGQRIMVNKTTGKRFVAQGASYERYEKDCGWFLKGRPSTPIDQPVTVKCIFYRKDNTRCDLTNLLEAIDDILVHYKILADDNFKIIESHDGSRVYVDKENPRTEICIYETSDVLLP